MAEVTEDQSPDKGEGPPQVLEEPPAPPVAEPTEEPPKPAPKKKGRPVGSKNKPKVVAVSVEPEPQEEIPAAPPPSPPKPKRARKAAQPARARPSGQPAQPATPVPIEPIGVAAAMLTALREQQQVRANNRRDKYASWLS